MGAVEDTLTDQPGRAGGEQGGVVEQRVIRGKPIWGPESEGRSLQVDRVQVSEDDPPPRAAVLLGLAHGERVIVRDRRYLLDGKPVLITRSYLPASLVRGTQIAQPDTGPGGTYARLADLGHAPTHFREDLRARMPEPGEVSALDLAPGTPVIEVIRTAYASDTQPVEASEMVATPAPTCSATTSPPKPHPFPGLWACPRRRSSQGRQERGCRGGTQHRAALVPGSNRPLRGGCTTVDHCGT
jgi:GntR family transcriptional regulator